MKSILFVCLGNICRSPLAQGIFEYQIKEVGLQDKFFADSAGTSAWHHSEKPHAGSIKVAQKHDIDISKQKSRPVSISDNNQFDLFVAMDNANYSSLKREFGVVDKKIIMMRQFEKKKDCDVPDPYGFGDDSFDKVYQILYENMSPLIQYAVELN